MSKIKNLLNVYKDHITVPWRDDIAAAQRVIFCVYTESEERTLRTKIEEFELITTQNNHKWCVYDFTDTFSKWLSSQKYAKSYYQKPNLLSSLLPKKYLEYLELEFNTFLENEKADSNTVVVLQGLGSLYGFVKIKDVVDKFAPKVSGRLLVFFPGSYENNNYRLLDGYDGWNYLAVPLTADK